MTATALSPDIESDHNRGARFRFLHSCGSSAPPTRFSYGATHVLGWKRALRCAPQSPAEPRVAKGAEPCLCLAGESESPGDSVAGARSSSISKVWVSAIETLVHAAFRWYPRRRLRISARRS
jgi:hypothetical protein